MADNSFDAILPPAMAKACEEAGCVKAGRDGLTLLALGILAGAFIALGAVFMTAILTGAGDAPWGLARLAGGLGFSLGLILVIVGGAELFTGDTLMVMAWAAGRVTWARLVKAWAIVYLGNIIGALGTAGLVFLAGEHGLAGGAFGKLALTIAAGKAAIPMLPLFFRAILCNVLVCLAVWMSFSARSTTDKVMVILLPIAAFVTAGFEHSIANLFFLPLGLFILHGAGAEFWAATGLAPDAFAALTPAAALANIAIATLGNLLGGSVLVGAVYWFIYLRRK
jgi:formate/nitrite transporter